MQVGEALRTFQEYHKNDPRDFLNHYFWSVLVKRIAINERLTNDYAIPVIIEEWCKQQYESNDWVRIGRKIWFTDQTQYAQFWLTWDEYLDKD